ncbi:380_t:CDS:2 [Funneliformis caledonium]|uniref:380_t:CDS:1 n=1 Tax=Funneliformis caledonium TaxID=1117310 RepID=A0A9N9HLU9_9GLOM|nr:380_t:CDS:2 [Funneliformis caledonium]
MSSLNNLDKENICVLDVHISEDAYKEINFVEIILSTLNVEFWLEIWKFKKDYRNEISPKIGFERVQPFNIRITTTDAPLKRLWKRCKKLYHEVFKPFTRPSLGLGELRMKQPKEKQCQMKQKQQRHVSFR